MICLYAGLISASGRGRKELFPRERNAFEIFLRFEIEAVKSPEFVEQAASDDEDVFVRRTHKSVIRSGA